MLSDGLLSLLEGSGLLADHAVQIHFEFDEQTGNEAFRIATEWDFDNDQFALSHYGVGLATGATVSEFMVPEPATLAFLLVGTAILRRRRTA